MTNLNLRLKKEINSYIANRFQHAVLNEAISLVENGICDFTDVDDALRFGPGLRWAFAGPAMCYHLGGGKGGVYNNDETEHFFCCGHNFGFFSIFC